MADDNFTEPIGNRNLLGISDQEIENPLLDKIIIKLIRTVDKSTHR